MKKIILSAALVFLMQSKTEACSWDNSDYDYFNLFTQTIIKDKTYLPFLHTLSNRFYGHEHYEIPNENIESWQKFFGNSLSYLETQILVEKMPMKDLNDFKKGGSGNSIIQKLGSYKKYEEGIDYLIEAKYLEPYMRINYIESPDSWYYRGDENEENATQLNYERTIAALTSLYNAAKIPEIKLRYGYQLVRFNHYTRRYDKSVTAFKNYVEPLKLKSATYFMALDQLGGAQRGLNLTSEANWNFFQVFMKSKSRKESAFISMKLSDSASFDNILKRAQTPEEKNMAYFLLGYDEYSNPIPMMEKMYDIDPNSEILKVLAARSINELERSYLPIFIYNSDPKVAEKNAVKTDHLLENKKDETSTKISFWQKVKNFFGNLFGSDEKDSTENGSNDSDKQLLNNPNRIPFYTKNDNLTIGGESKDFLDDFGKLTSKIKGKSNDEFWQIADAYLSFLQKDYEKSTESLNQIETSNPEYLAEIDRMKMLNGITSQPRITEDFEEDLYKNYKEFFVKKSPLIEKDSTADNFGYEDYNNSSTDEFLKDILANRYFLQGEDAKSFLMNNQLSDLRYNPNLDLARKLQSFINKKDKSNFEKEIIARNIDEVGNTEAFFNLIYGDFAMRSADFDTAKKHYEKANGFSGIPVPKDRYDYNTGEYVKIADPSKSYDGYRNISGLIFGHNIWESYESDNDTTMQAESFVSEFPFIKKNMTKAELADALIQLKKIGAGTKQMAANANQLIGNLLYNTSVLGYYREVFVMDIDNSNGGKYYFLQSESPFQYYYKDYSSNIFIKPDNFDLAIQFYKKGLENTIDKEQKARILFQMASAEQGKYYQYEANNSLITDYNDPNWSQKQDDFMKTMDQTKNQKYRTYFADLKKNYGDTKMSKSLRGSCSYYEYFLRR